MSLTGALSDGSGDPRAESMTTDSPRYRRLACRSSMRRIAKFSRCRRSLTFPMRDREQPAHQCGHGEEPHRPRPRKPALPLLRSAPNSAAESAMSDFLRVPAMIPPVSRGLNGFACRAGRPRGNFAGTLSAEANLP